MPRGRKKADEVKASTVKKKTTTKKTPKKTNIKVNNVSVPVNEKMSKLEEQAIRKLYNEKQEKDQRFVMWSGVLLVMACILTVWFWNLDKVFQVENESENFSDIVDLDEISTTVNEGMAGIKEQLELFKKLQEQENLALKQISTSTDAIPVIREDIGDYSTSTKESFVNASSTENTNEELLKLHEKLKELESKLEEKNK